MPLYTAIPACVFGCGENGCTAVKLRRCIICVRYWLTFCAAVAGVEAALGVGEGVVGLVHPAAGIGTTEDTTYVILGKSDAEKQFTKDFLPQMGDAKVKSYYHYSYRYRLSDEDW